MPGSPARGRLPGTQLARSECWISERMDKASVNIDIVWWEYLGSIRASAIGSKFTRALLIKFLTVTREQT